MSRAFFKLTKEHIIPVAPDILRAFIQSDSTNPVIGSWSESNAGRINSASFGLRNFGGNNGVVITAFLIAPISAGQEVDFTIDQDGANFHTPIPF